MSIWLNGQLLENGAVDASSAGVMLGWGVFTTVGVRGGAPLFAARHVERLRRDANEAGIEMPFLTELVLDGIRLTLENNLVTDGLLRLTLTKRGDGRWNDTSGADLSIQTVPVTPLAHQIRVLLSRYRVESKRPLAGVKTTSYLPNFWTWREAQSQGFDETILRDGQDFLSEGARSNLFWMKDDRIFTPSLDTGCLRGLGRELLMEWAQLKQIEVVEGQFSISELEESDATFLVSAASGPRQISSWHEETGKLLFEWSIDSSLTGELQSWWEQIGWT